MLQKNTFDWMRQQLNGYMALQHGSCDQT